ncbi:hypothetical protein PF002_g19208 [Phytophthora fragariae]|uniref:Uncharacterized protein n=1 Tax=Phytophthora fragariae TaxID=53985 RepID=A0A6A3E9W5_9STRA|nr:hypothetical protein PF003_g26806 [Phytophthora fragariae]KAE8927850.1 hypothetical protein PF009_g21993 [Phytophthora fragariae]KAE8981708.1 hypothetical protein PF011_g21920 [Phytophthora fragariae]KAE9101575.1 hypothetical protein PF006_g22639 [Phytophthora fragariae]KAE9209098.1 hypothetical protein PF002_g19208 [Phytophthora fragariae]
MAGEGVTTYPPGEMELVMLVKSVAQYVIGKCGRTLGEGND